MTRGEACLAFVLLLELAIRIPLCYFIYGNERQAWVDLWLLLSKCGKLWHGGLRQGRLTMVWLAESGCCILCQAVTTKAKSSSPRHVTSNIPQSPLWYLDLRLTDSQHSNHTNPGYSNRVRVHAAHDNEHSCHDSSTLCRGCTHSPWVMIILDS
jgi:hypothetical protein